MRAVSRSLILLLLVSLLGLPAAPAVAQTGCTPAGGQAIPNPSTIPSGDFVVIGGGWGHGVGMSQYGAQGAAKLGCTSHQILQTYYPGVTVGQAPALPETFRVSLWPERPGGTPVPAICLRAHTGTPVWQPPGAPAITQPNGSLWRVDVLADGSYRIRQFSAVDACRAGTEGTGAEVWAGGTAGTVLRVPLDGPPIVQLTSKSTNTVFSEGRPYADGTMEFFSVAGAAGAAAGATYLTLQLDTFAGRNALERYLRGLSEMPSSWEPAALQAQAITGRSYAQDKWESFKGNRSGCRCDVYDSTSDQVYSGYLKESEGTYGPRWVAAVDATAGQTMRYGGKTAVGYYSSSHGGHSESNTFVWGSAQVPYLRPVDDSRWDLASPNTLRRWTAAFTKEQMGAAFGVGTATSVTLLEPRGAMGRLGNPAQGYGGVRISGTGGTKTVSGDAFRIALGLRSTLVTEVRQSVAADRCAPTGASTAGVSRHSGPGRVETAVAASSGNWPQGGVSHALLATSENFPDALASGSLAAALDAPLLLTPKVSLHPAVEGELARLGVSTVWILGGESAISAGVEQELRNLGYETRRVRGANRFETARNIAMQPAPRTVNTVALGMAEDWPSAVTAGAFAATPERIPTLLVQRDAVPDITEQALRELSAKEVLLIGGTGVVSAGVENRLRQLGYTVRRLSGPSRYDTAKVVATEVLADLPAGERPLVVATGKDFPDALSAAALAARLDGPLLLAPQCTLEDSPPTSQFLSANKSRLGRAAVVGGRSAISDRVLEQLSAGIAG